MTGRSSVEQRDYCLFADRRDRIEPTRAPAQRSSLPPLVRRAALFGSGNWELCWKLEITGPLRSLLWQQLRLLVSSGQTVKSREQGATFHAVREDTHKEIGAGAAAAAMRWDRHHATVAEAIRSVGIGQVVRRSSSIMVTRSGNRPRQRG